MCPSTTYPTSNKGAIPYDRVICNLDGFRVTRNKIGNTTEIDNLGT